MKKNKQIYIISGMSGAGKSQALKCFEDFGFYCIDNLPIKLLPKLAELIDKEDYLKKVALGIDVRGAKFYKNFSEALNCFKKYNLEYRLIFLDCQDTVLLQRFSETRHKHPLGDNIQKALRKERKILSVLQERADKIIDTTKTTLGELKENLSSLLNYKDRKEFNINLISFGYKYGIPMDADIVMDVRFLPNPFYVKKLKNKTGLDASVRNYLKRNSVFTKFVNSWFNELKSIIPYYIKEGKVYLTVAVGCTGGKHRSVSVVLELHRKLTQLGYSVSLFHRDVRK